MRTRLRLVLALILLSLVSLAAPAHASTPGYLTLLFSRSVVAPAINCQVVKGSVPLEQTLAWLHGQGLAATGSVVTDDVTDSEACARGMIDSSWPELAHYRDDYGFTVVSAGEQHTDFSQMSPAMQQSDVKDSLDIIRAHGHVNGDAMFLPASGQITKDEQAQVVAPVYSTTRVYRRVLNEQSTYQRQFIGAWGVTGGACNDPSLACYSLQTSYSQTRYDSPDALLAYAKAKPGQYAVVQIYALMTGSGPTFDCSGPDWHTHWSERPEWYCQNDYRRMVQAAKASGVQVVSPRTVADAWR